MRIAHVSDIHLSVGPDPRDIGATMVEQEAVLWAVVEDIGALSPAPDLITIGGDLYDAGSTPDLRIIARRWMESLARTAPVFIVEGNHEHQRDVMILRQSSLIAVSTSPEFFAHGGAVVATLPWPRRGALAAYAAAHGLEVKPEEAIRAVLDGIRLRFAEHQGPRIILGHLDVSGSRLDNGQPVVGKAFLTVSPHDLAATGADAALLGHIHARQTIEIEQWVIDQPHAAPRRRMVPVHFPGCLKPTAVGQGSEFGYSVVDVERGGPVSIAFRPIAKVRALHQMVMEWCAPKVVGEQPSLAKTVTAAEGLWHVGGDMPPRGASVRLLARFPAGARTEARARAEEAAEDMRHNEGCRVALVEEVQRDERAPTRGAEVVAARSVREKLEAWWSTGRPPNEAALLDDLARLEEEEAP